MRWRRRQNRKPTRCALFTVFFSRRSDQVSCSILKVITKAEVESANKLYERCNVILPDGRECKICGRIGAVCNAICEHPWMQELIEVESFGTLSEAMLNLLDPKINVIIVNKKQPCYSADDLVVHFTGIAR